MSSKTYKIIGGCWEDIAMSFLQNGYDVTASWKSKNVEGNGKHPLTKTEITIYDREDNPVKEVDEW